MHEIARGDAHDDSTNSRQTEGLGPSATLGPWYARAGGRRFTHCPTLTRYSAS